MYFLPSGEGAVSVSEYLERARECAAMAETSEPEEKKKLLEIAEAWLKLADEAAKLASNPTGIPNAITPSPSGSPRTRQ
jgi:hypothetical protein